MSDIRAAVKSIERKIVGVAVVEKPVELPPQPVHMNESLVRPEMLIGSTYKIKSPLIEHAMYVTLNDIVLNEGTDHEVRRPFEIFINSKNMDQFQWVVALTRILSAVFRKGGDATFLVDEMKAVFDPRGGYFKPGGVYMPSIIAEIGAILERHMLSIGMLTAPVVSEEARALIEEKKKALGERLGAGKPGLSVAVNPGAVASATHAAAHAVDAGAADSGFPATASLCSKCHTKAVVVLDGCATCLSCGASKCG